MQENRENLLRWLRVLFYIHLAGSLLSALALAATAVPFSLGSWYTWARRAVSPGIVVCLYLLPGRYRLAGMTRALSLLCNLIALAVHPVLYALGVRLAGAGYALVYTLLAGASELLAMMAVIPEYTAHAAAAPGDKTKWYIFLACSLAVTLASSVFAAVLQPILPKLDVLFIRFWNLGTRALSLAVRIVYLVLLHRVIRKQEEA